MFPSERARMTDPEKRGHIFQHRHHITTPLKPEPPLEALMSRRELGIASEEKPSR